MRGFILWINLELKRLFKGLISKYVPYLHTLNQKSLKKVYYCQVELFQTVYTVLCSSAVPYARAAEDMKIRLGQFISKKKNFHLNFILSKKAPKIDKIFTVDLTLHMQ